MDELLEQLARLFGSKTAQRVRTLREAQESGRMTKLPPIKKATPAIRAVIKDMNDVKTEEKRISDSLKEYDRQITDMEISGLAGNMKYNRLVNERREEQQRLQQVENTKKAIEQRLENTLIQHEQEAEPAKPEKKISDEDLSKKLQKEVEEEEQRMIQEEMKQLEKEAEKTDPKPAQQPAPQPAPQPAQQPAPKQPSQLRKIAEEERAKSRKEIEQSEEQEAKRRRDPEQKKRLEQLRKIAEEERAKTSREFKQSEREEVQRRGLIGDSTAGRDQQERQFVSKRIKEEFHEKTSQERLNASYRPELYNAGPDIVEDPTVGNMFHEYRNTNIFNNLNYTQAGRSRDNDLYIEQEDQERDILKGGEIRTANHFMESPDYIRMSPAFFMKSGRSPFSNMSIRGTTKKLFEIAPNNPFKVRYYDREKRALDNEMNIRWRF